MAPEDSPGNCNRGSSLGESGKGSGFSAWFRFSVGLCGFCLRTRFFFWTLGYWKWAVWMVMDFGLSLVMGFGMCLMGLDCGLILVLGIGLQSGSVCG